jgi:16S rRNA (guanine527-N7)-methyltransferase
LQEGAEALGVSLDDSQLERFATYLALLISANETTNLTSVRDSDGIIRRHFLESLALGTALFDRHLLTPGSEVLDLGSGAGFPGLPVKIAWPQIGMALLESTGKKARFLAGVVEDLELHGTAVLTGRAEDIAHSPVWRAKVDLVVARSVAAMPALVELSLPFLKLGGVLAALKGSRAGEELIVSGRALDECGGRVTEQTSLGIGALDVVLVQKAAPTPDIYPRRAGRPARRPLGPS